MDEERIIKQVEREMRAKLASCIIPGTLMPYLTCLTDHDRENIRCEIRINGDRDGANMLLDRLKKKGPQWYKELINALREDEVGLSELADDFETRVAQRLGRSQSSPTGQSSYQPQHLPPALQPNLQATIQPYQQPLQQQPNQIQSPWQPNPQIHQSQPVVQGQQPAALPVDQITRQPPHSETPHPQLNTVTSPPAPQIVTMETQHTGVTNGASVKPYTSTTPLRSVTNDIMEALRPLNVENVFDRNWKGLAGRFDISTEDVAQIELAKNPTEELYRTLSNQDVTMGALVDRLHQLERYDVLGKIEDITGYQVPKPKMTVEKQNDDSNAITEEDLPMPDMPPQDATPALGITSTEPAGNGYVRSVSDADNEVEAEPVGYSRDETEKADSEMPQEAEEKTETETEDLATTSKVDDTVKSDTVEETQSLQESAPIKQENEEKLNEASISSPLEGNDISDQQSSNNMENFEIQPVEESSEDKSQPSEQAEQAASPQSQPFQVVAEDNQESNQNMEKFNVPPVEAEDNQSSNQNMEQFDVPPVEAEDNQASNQNMEKFDIPPVEAEDNQASNQNMEKFDVPPVEAEDNQASNQNMEKFDIPPVEETSSEQTAGKEAEQLIDNDDTRREEIQQAVEVPIEKVEVTVLKDDNGTTEEWRDPRFIKRGASGDTNDVPVANDVDRTKDEETISETDVKKETEQEGGDTHAKDTVMNNLGEVSITDNANANGDHVEEEPTLNVPKESEDEKKVENVSIPSNELQETLESNEVTHTGLVEETPVSESLQAENEITGDDVGSDESQPVKTESPSDSSIKNKEDIGYLLLKISVPIVAVAAIAVGVFLKWRK
ncbi:uncharacterized protein LOC144446537 [Glandiceps talaboti]